LEFVESISLGRPTTVGRSYILPVNLFCAQTLISQSADRCLVKSISVHGCVLGVAQKKLTQTLLRLPLPQFLGAKSAKFSLESPLRSSASKENNISQT